MPWIGKRFAYRNGATFGQGQPEYGFQLEVVAYALSGVRLVSLPLWDNFTGYGSCWPLVLNKHLGGVQMGIPLPSCSLDDEKSALRVDCP